MLAFVLIIIAIALVLYALGWVPTGAVWSGIVSGAKTLIITPINDLWVLTKRIALGVAIILLLGAALGAPPAPVGPGGSYEDLRNAIIAYQLEHGLTGDGIWGKQTNSIYLKGN